MENKFKCLFLAGVSGNARQRRRIVRHFKKRYEVRYLSEGLYFIGVLE